MITEVAKWHGVRSFGYWKSKVVQVKREKEGRVRRRWRLCNGNITHHAHCKYDGVMSLNA